MLVYEFMIPADKVIKVTSSDTIGDALDKMLEHHISAVVVEENDTAVGIITKTDIAKAYKESIPLNEKAEAIMTRQVKTVLHSLQRDVAAKVFSESNIHHAIVVDNDGKFVGLISAWDCAKEGALDHHAWPWNRRMMGRRI